MVIKRDKCIVRLSVAANGRCRVTFSAPQRWALGLRLALRLYTPLVSNTESDQLEHERGMSPT